METKHTCFCEEGFIDRLFLVLEIFVGGEGRGGRFGAYTSDKSLW